MVQLHRGDGDRHTPPDRVQIDVVIPVEVYNAVLQRVADRDAVSLDDSAVAREMTRIITGESAPILRKAG